MKWTKAIELGPTHYRIDRSECVEKMILVAAALRDEPESLTGLSPGALPNQGARLLLAIRRQILK